MMLNLATTWQPRSSSESILCHGAGSKLVFYEKCFRLKNGPAHPELQNARKRALLVKFPVV